MPTYGKRSGGGGLATLVAGSGVTIDATDPSNPIVTVTSPVTQQVLGADATTVTFSSLNSATEFGYELHYALAGDPAGDVVLRINADATNHRVRGSSTISGVLLAVTSDTALLGRTGYTSTVGIAIVSGGAGAFKPISIEWNGFLAGVCNGLSLPGGYYDNTAAITSLVVTGPANGLKSGSVFTLFKKRVV